MPAAMIIRGSNDIDDSGFEAVSPVPLIASGVLRIKAGNSGTVTVRWADDTDNAHVLEPGTAWQLVNVDLSKIELQGSAADQGYEFVGDTNRGI